MRIEALALQVSHTSMRYIIQMTFDAASSSKGENR